MKLIAPDGSELKVKGFVHDVALWILLGVILIGATAAALWASDNRTGCRFLTVDAYRGAIDFYKKNDFIEVIIPEEDKNKKSSTVPMYYDLKRVQL